MVEEKQNDKKKYKFLLILFIFLLVLNILVFVILITRLSDFSFYDTNTVFLIDEKSSYKIHDKEKTWATSNNINIFKSMYIDETGKTFVKGEEKAKIIAPGTSNDYSFNIKNNGNVNLVYTVKFVPILEIDNKKANFDEFPIRVCIKKNDDEYLIGGSGKCATLQEISNFSYENTLLINNYNNYTIYWEWDKLKPDVSNTSFGIRANNTKINLTFKILTSALVSEKINDTEYDNSYPTFSENNNNINDNNNSNIKIFIVIIVLFIISSSYFTIKYFRKCKEEKE